MALTEGRVATQRHSMKQAVLTSITRCPEPVVTGGFAHSEANGEKSPNNGVSGRTDALYPSGLQVQKFLVPAVCYDQIIICHR